MNNLVLINNQELQVKEFNNQRVVTFKEIDKVHERVEGTAGRNFRENKKHFIKDEDYFYLEGKELSTIKQTTNFVGSNARELILLTETGYLMLVKSFTDDLAWKVQRQLVNSYFRVREEIKTLEAVNESIKLITPIFEDLKIDKSMQFLVAKTFFKKAGVDIPLEIEEKEHFYDTKQIAKKLGLYTMSNKPAFQAVKQIIRKLDIKEDETKTVLETNGSWTGTVTKYSNKVTEKVKMWLKENNNPISIKGDKKNYYILYKNN
ncbi:ORF6N domain-containing protein [Clostridioides difficile]|uniref:ORF6N domain-containing protein n=1 Tax=Clostridioides difficile TaxID=1496 RepID=UPI00038D85BF|nr:ORF6N domain-containing protein [Clostridioides difficile]CCL66831.1 putative Toxin-antitoxin system, toxin component, Bro family [Clostridioides difficile E7]EGT3754162.1 ORF6N domain-containing protein [Clostridioides difficile]EGT3870288.1 ORF6N domain-containing protein [Clostridioides difficile]EGT4042053.1 ORF6N domain-containing protein [Clostridioides difficile]EGT4147804.1 ORF6N domain-containing protein [Clostridioides difficile]